MEIKAKYPMNKTICVLEDNEDILSIITMVLDDFRVLGYGTVSEFFTAAPFGNPSLFLLDVMLPDGNGLEVCQELKSSPETAHIPVIVMTANSRIQQMSERGCADDYIAKPFDIDDLTKRIIQLIGQYRTDQNNYPDEAR